MLLVLLGWSFVKISERKTPKSPTVYRGIAEGTARERWGFLIHCARQARVLRPGRFHW